MSLATRLALVALLVTLVSLAVTATVGLVRGSDLADEIADDRFVTIASSRGDAVEAAATSIQRSVIALAASPATADAITDLGDAYLELNTGPIDAAATSDLTEYYLADVIPALEDVRGTRVGASFLVPDGSAAVYLQNAYTVPHDPDDADAEGDIDGESAVTIAPDLVVDAGDGSDYSALHAEVHQVYGQIAAQSGFDDLYLIDARSDTIVYSARKRIDFATSLDLGPHSGSSLARLLDTFGSDDVAGRFTDFAPYVPRDERPTAFVASPVVDDGELVGFVAGALTVDTFDTIISGGGDWDGFGDSGEAYLVGPDATMRSTARSFVESASAYLAATTEPGPAQLTDEQRRRMAETGTTALVQPVDRNLVAVDGASGLIDTVDHLARDVRVAYLGLDIEGVDWTIAAQIDRDELDGPIEDYARQMLFAVALFIVAVTFISVRWSNRLMAPIRRIADRLRLVRVRSEAGERIDPDELTAGDDDGPTEYQELSENVDQMLARLAARRSEVEARSKERAALLRQFLPAAVARRSEETDGEVLDHVRNASVVVITLDGLGSMVGDAPDTDVRNLLGDVVDEVDALAVEMGLERIKLTGSTYYAVCGVSRPYLDHAPRAVGFALAARDVVHELSEGRLDLRGAVASGPVSVGLAARSALVYDVWGETVARAESLARSAPGRTIMATDDVRTQLPDSFVVAGDPDGGAVAVTERLVDRGAPA